MSIIIPKIKLFFQIHIPPQTTTNTHPQTNNHHLQHVPTQHYSTTYQQSLITPHSTTVSATRPKGGWLRLLTSGRYPINATVIARSSDSEAELRFYLLDGTAFCISVFATRPTTAGSEGEELRLLLLILTVAILMKLTVLLVMTSLCQLLFSKSEFVVSILTSLVTF